MAQRTCIKDDCGRPAKRLNGMCDRCYREELDSRKPPCEAPGCTESHSHIRGFCHRHYDNMRRYGTLEPPPAPSKAEKPKCKYSDDIDGACTKDAHCRGWCEVHYTRWRIHGDPGIVLARKRAKRRDPVDVDVESKVCSKCERRLPLDAFYKRATTLDGLMYRCKDCCRDYYNKRYAEDEDFRAYRRDKADGYQARSAERRRERTRRRSFDQRGITEEEYIALAAQQGGVCAICKQPPSGNGPNKRLAIDHHHDTGLIRGLLCGPCNTGIGMFKDDPGRLAAAIRYLESAGLFAA